MTTTPASRVPCFKNSLLYLTEVKTTWTAIVNHKWTLQVRNIIPALCSGCSEFRYRFWHWLSWLRISFSKPLQSNSVIVSQIRPRRFLPYISQFITHPAFDAIQSVPGGRVNILGGHSIRHLSKKVYMHMCPIPNGFRDRIISPYSSKIVDKKDILRTASNTGIYCSSDKVGTVYLV
jgi:hypothetical protein